MDKTVNKALFDAWINEQYPNAIGKLSVATEIPVSSLSQIRGGRVPKDKDRRDRLARAIGVEESELFPPARGNNRAS